MALTVKQQRFVEEYCVSFNASDAARRAGYSQKTAANIGHENLRKPEIAEAVAHRLDELSMTAEEATKRLTDWGRGRIDPFLRQTATGEVLVDLSTKEAQDALHLVREIQVDETRHGDDLVTAKVKIKLHDAKDATVQIAKIRGLYVDRVDARVEVSGVLKVPDVDPSQWRQAAKNRITEPSSSGNTNGSGG